MINLQSIFKKAKEGAVVTVDDAVQQNHNSRVYPTSGRSETGTTEVQKESAQNDDDTVDAMVAEKNHTGRSNHGMLIGAWKLDSVDPN